MDHTRAVGRRSAMLAFTFGIVSALIAVGRARDLARGRLRETRARPTPALMLVNAAALSYLAWRNIAG